MTHRWRIRVAGVVFLGMAAWLMLRALPVSSKDDLQFDRQRAQAMLDLTTAELEKNYYDPTMHGLNWTALKEDARAKIQTATSNGQMLGIVFGLVDKLQDSHTIFIAPPHALKIKYGFNAKPVGDQILIDEVKKGEPAERAGLQPGDHLLAVNGFGAERKSFDKMWLYFRVLNPRPSLDLDVARGSEAPHKVTVQADIKQGSAMMDLTKIETIWELLREEERESKKPAYHATYPGEIGYVRWRAFYYNYSSLQENLLKVGNSKALILDLRGNSGGAEDSLKALLGFFESEPIVVATLPQRKKTEEMKVKPRKPEIEGPIFVLVDSESSSASEIFARHLQLRKKAVIVGDQTSGRVEGARVFTEHAGVDIGLLFAIEISMERVIFPGGEDLEGHGVTPDKACLPTPDGMRERRDTCRGLAVQLARAALKLPDLTKDELSAVEQITKDDE